MNQKHIIACDGFTKWLTEEGFKEGTPGSLYSILIKHTSLKAATIQAKELNAIVYTIQELNVDN